MNKILYKTLKNLNFWSFPRHTVLVPPQPKRLTECISVAWLLSAQRQMTKFTEAETDFTSKLNVRWSVWPKIHGAKSYKECWAMVSGGRRERWNTISQTRRHNVALWDGNREEIQTWEVKQTLNLTCPQFYIALETGAWITFASHSDSPAAEVWNLPLQVLKAICCFCLRHLVRLLASVSLQRCQPAKASKCTLLRKPSLTQLKQGERKWGDSGVGRLRGGEVELLERDRESVFQRVWEWERERLHQRVCWVEVLRNLLITDQAPPSF